MALIRVGNPNGEPNATDANAFGPGSPLRIGAFALRRIASLALNPSREVPISMAVSQSYLDYVLDQLNELGSVFSKRMFGGVGLYCDDVFFGLIADDVLYLKVDEETKRRYEAAGSGPFQPYGEGSYSMSYYAVPIEVLDDIDEIQVWAREAVSVARKKQSEKSTRKKSRKPAKK